ncbi:MAG: GNAT family N-acetyltransferase [Oscillospiraceae bacterium]|nr:GNAT family N-acetyltransferase [Oscillospiraceae bacterium]
MITLRQIDTSNYLDCFRLRLGADQARFVSDPVRSLAQAYVYREQCVPFGIYAQDTMVGYVLVLYDPDERTYNIWHMMIDGACQNRGYGRQALGQVLAYIAAKPFGASDRVLLTCDPANRRAYHLYASLDFHETGRRDGEEVELARAL